MDCRIDTLSLFFLLLTVIRTKSLLFVFADCSFVGTALLRFDLLREIFRYEAEMLNKLEKI